MTAPSRVTCSAAPVDRERPLTTESQCHGTDPSGEQDVFCSGAGFLRDAVPGPLSADVARARHNETPSGEKAV